jgi:hypothetical protein
VRSRTRFVHTFADLAQIDAQSQTGLIRPVKRGPRKPYGRKSACRGSTATRSFRRIGNLWRSGVQARIRGRWGPGTLPMESGTSKRGRNRTLRKHCPGVADAGTAMPFVIVLCGSGAVIRNERSRAAIERIGGALKGFSAHTGWPSTSRPRYSIVAAEWPSVQRRINTPDLTVLHRRA